jgi:hypothetical protein
VKTRKLTSAGSLALCLVLLSLPRAVRAWEPSAKELDAAIGSGDFGKYYADISAWLEQKTPEPAKITEAAMADLIKTPVFRSTLDHRQFIAKHGVTNMSAFAKVEANREFLAWAMKNAELMDMYLEAATPARDRDRQTNTYTIGIGALERWKQLYTEDPDTRAGTFLRLGMAAALCNPGGGGQYRSDDVSDWLRRYKHFKTAHQNKELVPSFDHLTVADYGRVLTGIGSDTDLAWGRKMIQTWRPDLLDKEEIPKIVSEVWRRFSPYPFTNGFITVMEGGGKCGPRGLFGAFICQAFGIPSIVVGQPAHCCFAARADFTETDPQIGSVWKVYQGRGWQVSDCGGAMYGPEFVSEMTKRYRTAEFSQVEHLRWLASTVSSKERADALRALAIAIRKPVNTSDPWGVPVAEVDVITAAKSGAPAARPMTAEAPIAVPPGVIHVEAEVFTNKSPEVSVFNCYTGGKQVNFFKSIQSSWVDYVVEAPEAGTYSMEVMLAAANRDQVLDVSCGTEKLGAIRIPGTRGLWEKMQPVDLKLNKGPQTLRISAPFQRGVAVRWFELTPKGSR